jgi:hypothetical protein
MPMLASPPSRQPLTVPASPKRIVHTYAWSLVALATLACTSTLGAAAQAGSLSNSLGKPRAYYQSYAYYGRSSADLVVRPDVLVVTFSLSKTADDPVAALAAVHAFVDDLGRRYRAVCDTASIELRTLSVSPAQDKVGAGHSVVVAGAVELPLAADWDYWRRAQVFINAAQLAQTVSVEQKDARKSLLASIGTPVALLKNPEALRGEILKAWIDSARSFSAQAQSKAAPLDLDQCDPPGRVTQQQLSFEEVALTLQPHCRLDVVKGKDAP